MKTDEDRFLRGYSEKLQAVEAEIENLRVQLREANAKADEAQSKLEEETKKTLAQQTEQLALQAQIISLRGQLSGALADAGKLRQELSDRDASLLQKDKEATGASMKLSMLRNYLGENGIVVEEDDLRSSSRSDSRTGITSSSTTADLESRLAERTRMHENTQRELAQSLQRTRDAETHVSELTNELQRMRANQGSRNGAGDPDSAARITELEQKLAKTDQALQTLTHDYRDMTLYTKWVTDILISEVIHFIDGGSTVQLIKCARK
jgi:chromosome segregation ATPase